MKILILLTGIFALIANFKHETKENETLCIVYFQDGTSKNGTIDLPIKSGGKHIILKNKDQKEKIELQTIDKLEVTINGGKIEYHNLKIYNALRKKIFKDKRMMIRAVKGKVNLYIATFDWTANINSGSGFQPMSLNGISYYCTREGEEAATLIHENFGQINKNADFKLYGSRYFSDHTTIAERIKSKEYTFEHIFAVIAEYNK